MDGPPPNPPASEVTQTPGELEAQAGAYDKVDGDGLTGFSDLLAVLNAWGTAYS